MSSQPPELGPTRRGPEFVRPSADGSQQPGPGRPFVGPGAPYGNGRQPGGPQPERPPNSRLPLVITIGVIALVAVIVLVASLRPDPAVQRETGNVPPTPTTSAAPQDTSTSIGFTSSEGSGRLSLLSHRWTGQGAANGAYLQLEVKIEATDGRLSFGPQYFQTFDSRSDLYQSTEVGARPPLLGNGYLRAGETVDGGIAFDMPRGEVTLLMSNARLESVTALRIS
ncbi:DUF4352 domain-containing protein [Microlunatus soli]|uniref:DUF4352 domain-containing protein n=1 Tax=Microlunatus soli TaxID=630515 RepID=A0A1H1YIF8_9ACTN|nr:hypothetical protein [Microlunatus soli]SDT21069.1 hypothetical protein SAMN04489812_4592 [Microlunatus soli]